MTEPGPGLLGAARAAVVVCVIGAGPRGLSVLERLCANAGDAGYRAPACTSGCAP